MPPPRLGRRDSLNPRKRRIDAPVNLAHQAHMQAWWVDAIEATGGEQITLFDVSPGRHELELKRPAPHGRTANRDVATASTGVHHGNTLVAVGEQSHLADQGVHACDLADNAGHIDHCRSLHDACNLPSVHHNAVGIGVGRVIEHFHGLGGPGDLGTQIQQLPQLGVFLLQLFDLLQAPGLNDGAVLKILSSILSLLQIAKVLAHEATGTHRLQ